MLALDGAAAHERLRAVLGDEAERVEEARRRLHAELRLVDGAQRRGGRGRRGRLEGRRRGEAEGDRELHL